MSDDASLTDEDRNWRQVRKRIASLQDERDQARNERDSLREELRRAQVALELTQRGYALSAPVAQVVIATEGVLAEDVAHVLSSHGPDGDSDAEPSVRDPDLTPEELAYGALRKEIVSGFTPETVTPDG